MAADAGADWVDLNVGCPIYEATRRNLGSALLRKPDQLAALVSGIADSSPLPLSVKVRLAAEGRKVNVREVVGGLIDAGAAAVTIHGRTAEARYSKAADWRIIGECVSDARARGSSVPIIGNGDILTYYEARGRMALSAVNGVMVGRGALTKPWIFDEFNSNRAWEPSAAERVGVYRQLTCYMKEHFGDDSRGRKKAWYFLPWHFDFLTRYRALPEAEFGTLALERPLIQTRMDDLQVEPLERLLAHASPAAHDLIAAKLWEATSDSEAVDALSALAESAELAGIDKGLDSSPSEAEAEDSELANIPSSGNGSGGAKSKRGKGRRNRTPPPQRTPEEIAALRAERAAKRERTGAPPHVNGRARAEKTERKAHASPGTPAAADGQQSTTV